MSINWWTLGLQAINVLILVWLLSRLFWRPVAEAIAQRQAAAHTLLDDAKTGQARVDAALAEITTTRAGLAAERDALLAEAATRTDAAVSAAMAEASEKAETLLEAARRTSERERDAARAKSAADAAVFAVDIARKLLTRLDAHEVHATFLDRLVETIDDLSSADKALLVGTAGGIDLLSAVELDDAARSKVALAVTGALGGEPRLNFLTDPDLIGGFEVRTAHVLVHDSWQSDLATILADLKRAA